MSGGKPGGPWLALSVQARRVSAAVGDADGVLASVDDGDLAPASVKPSGDHPDQARIGARFAGPAPTSRLALAIIDRALSRAQVGLGDLAGLCVADGPGPFTAIRVAMSLIQGIGVARRLPVVPTPSLAALAVTMARGSLASGATPPPGGDGQPAPRSALVLTAVDARMGECYFGAWWVTVGGPAGARHQARWASPGFERPVLALASGVGSGERIRPAFEHLLSTLASASDSEGRVAVMPAAGRHPPLVLLAGSGFQVDPVLAAWRPGGNVAGSPEAGIDVLVDAAIEADAAGVLTAALAPRAGGPAAGLAADGLAGDEMAADEMAAVEDEAVWGPIAAADLRPRYVRDKVALDVDEQRRLVAARDAASSRA